MLLPWQWCYPDSVTTVAATILSSELTWPAVHADDDAVAVESRTDMVGSYGPKSELQSFTTKPEQAPSGMLARGTYTIKSLFTDDDKNEHLKWEWKLEIKK